jgi:hypothetical protein
LEKQNLVAIWLVQMGLLIWFRDWQCRASWYDWEFDLITTGNKITTAGESIFSAKTRAGILLAVGFSTFTLDFQTGISWAFDIEIMQFKNPYSSICTELQLSWRIQIQIKSFWKTESGRNLVGRNGSPNLIQKLTMLSIPIRLRVWPKNSGP